MSVRAENDVRVRGEQHVRVESAGSNGAGTDEELRACGQGQKRRRILSALHAKQAECERNGTTNGPVTRRTVHRAVLDNCSVCCIRLRTESLRRMVDCSDPPSNGVSHHVAI